MGESVYLEEMELGPMQNFVYLIGDRAARECVVVDPAWQIDSIAGAAEQDDMRLVGALVTHTHQDHVGGHLFGFDIPGVAELLHRTPMKVYVHQAEREFLKGFGSDLVKVEGGQTLTVGAVTITFIHTPGHTPGSQCFLVDGRLISGDTLFIRSCGRTDLPGSDPAEMYDSLTRRLGSLPDDTVVYPGHDYGEKPTSTLGEERRTNTYLKVPTLEMWLRMMGG